MFRLEDISVTGSVVSMFVLINCQESKKYRLTLDTSGERVSIIETELPDDLISYVGKIEAKLRDFKGKKLPTELTVAWY